MTLPTPPTLPTPADVNVSATGAWRTYADPDWARFAGEGWLARVMAVPVPDRFHAKQGRSIGRWTLQSGADTLVVYLKRHFVLPRRHAWLARRLPNLAWSPGWQEYANLRWAAAHGLPVPRVLAAGEWRGRGLQSFLAVEELAGMSPLHEAIPLAAAGLAPEAFAAWKSELIDELARLTRELHRRRAYHQDLYLCHFYVRTRDAVEAPESWRGRVAMIDFHRLVRRPWARRYYQVKDLAQLAFSTVGVAGVEAGDLERFGRAYRAGDWGAEGPPPRWLGRCVRWKAARYEGHNRKLVAGSSS